MLKEKEFSALNGIPFLVVLLGVGIVFAYGAFMLGEPLLILGIFACVFCIGGFFTVSPNEAKVIQLFGNYVGTVRNPGLKWVIPFYSRHSISLRVRNFDSNRLKVNDNHGSPIEIAAVVVWQVVDSAEALFEVDRFEDYVVIQTEAALRKLAMSYPYDSHDGPGISLQGSPDEVSEHLKREVQARLEKAGVSVLETRISHLAYAPEIAASMLQRQQAGAIVAARARIVEGAVGMVEMALSQLNAKKIVNLDESLKAQMVSNLMVVLCSERSTQPVVNTTTSA